MNRQIKENLDELQRREDVILDYYRNYKNLRANNEYGKAGEVLWGMVSNLLEAISITLGGPKGLGHTQKQRLIKQIANEQDNEEILDAFEDAETLHAKGFYQGMVDKREFNRLTSNIENELIPALKFVYQKKRGEAGI